MRRGWIDEQLAASRALYRRKCERHARRARALHAGGRALDAPARRLLLVADAPAAATRPTSRGAPPRRGVGIVPGTLFFPTAAAATNVRLSFSMVDEAQIDDGIERLASLVSA